MNDIEGTKFQVPILKSQNHFSLLNDIEVFYRGRGLWRFVHDPKNDEILERGVDGNDATKRDLAFAYIITSVVNSCKALIRQMKCPWEARVTMREPFYVMGEAAIDAKITKMQAMSLQKGELVIEFSNRLVQLVSKLEAGSH